MTVLEMHTAIDILVDKIASNNYPNITPIEKDFYLNKAQDTFIKQRYGTTNLKRDSFEETQKRTEDIKNIVYRASLPVLANDSDNINSVSRFVELPLDHLITIQELATINYTCGNNEVATTKIVPVEPIQHNDYSKIINNPFKKPTTDKVLRLMASGKIELIPASGVNITSYKMTYIKEPIRIDSTTLTGSELSSITHDEIVNMAVGFILEGIEAERVKTFDPLVQNRQE